jgi:hypothetical protein
VSQVVFSSEFCDKNFLCSVIKYILNRMVGISINYINYLCFQCCSRFLAVEWFTWTQQLLDGSLFWNHGSVLCLLLCISRI